MVDWIWYRYQTLNCVPLCFQSTRGQWRKVFFISSGVYAFGAIFFAIFASGKEQAWSKPEFFEESRRRHAKEEGFLPEDDQEPLLEN